MKQVNAKAAGAGGAVPAWETVPASRWRRLDALTRALTAFGSWAEFRQAMAGGYVPTIRPLTKRHGELARLVRGEGFRVWGVEGRDWK